MAYTHTFEFNVGIVNLEGELDFDTVEEGCPTILFKLSGTEEENLHQRAIVQQFMCCLNQIHQHVGEITKIEVVPK